VSASQKATAQLHVRIPPAEKEQLREQARRYGISISALVRINNETRERAAEIEKTYPRG
jgi:hypothetical protein